MGEVSSPNKLLQFLKSTKINEIETPNQKDVVEVNVTMSPVEAAKELWKHNVLGAPVWDDKNKKYIGFFDVRDLLSTVVASHKEQEGLDKTTFPAKWFKSRSTKSTTSTFTVSYLAARDPFVSLTDDATLEDICKLCSDRSCHRVPIVDKTTGRCTRIVSQSALVKFLVQHLADNKGQALDDKFSIPLVDCKSMPYKKQVVTAPDTATARDVFELMDSNRLSGIAIVDPSDGSLKGNTSATDIKLAVAVEEGAVVDLNLDIMSYLSEVRQVVNVKNSDTRYPFTSVKESSTVGHCMRVLAKTGYHRVFVVDQMLKPIGVISVTDIVKFIVEE